MNRKPSVLLFIVFTISPAFAQWVPIQGRMVSTTESFDSSGRLLSKWSTVSGFARSSNGSTLTTRYGKSGLPYSATLVDRGKTGHSYLISYHSGLLKDLHRPNVQTVSKPPSFLSDTQKKVSLGKDAINGTECFILPVYGVGPNRTRVLIGKAWMAPAYNGLILHEDLTISSTNGAKKHIVRDLSNISTNEPDRKLFSTDHTALLQVFAEKKQ